MAAVVVAACYVMSAAHCHVNYRGVTITSVRVGVTRVEGGEHDTYTVRGRREIFTVGDPQVVNVSNIIVHPDFVRESSGVGLNDLVLLKLKTPVTFGPLVQPVCLPDGDQMDRGVATVVGWGDANKDDLKMPHVSSQNHLQVADLDILSDRKCTEHCVAISKFWRSRSDGQYYNLGTDPFRSMVKKKS